MLLAFVGSMAIRGSISVLTVLKSFEPFSGPMSGQEANGLVPVDASTRLADPATAGRAIANTKTPTRGSTARRLPNTDRRRTQPLECTIKRPSFHRGVT